jgi:hypothetical protein
LERVVVPRTTESSTSTTRLPSTTSAMMFSFIATARSRCAWPGRMNVRPTKRFGTIPSSNGMPDSRWNPTAALRPESGIGIT